MVSRWFVVFAVTPLVAAPLVECPDCGSAVSSRAVMCPRCGAPAEAISEAVAKAAAEETKAPDDVLVAKVNGRACYALPVSMKDGSFAVLPANVLAGLETLELFFASTNAPVAYGTPSVAQGAPLVRLPLAETNLAFHAVATKADEGFVFDPAALPPEGGGAVAAMRNAPADAQLADIPISDKLLWRDVPPRELKAMFQTKQETP